MIRSKHIVHMILCALCCYTAQVRSDITLCNILFDRLAEVGDSLRTVLNETSKKCATACTKLEQSPVLTQSLSPEQQAEVTARCEKCRYYTESEKHKTGTTPLIVQTPGNDITRYSQIIIRKPQQQAGEAFFDWDKAMQGKSLPPGEIIDRYQQVCESLSTQDCCAFYGGKTEKIKTEKDGITITQDICTGLPAKIPCAVTIFKDEEIAQPWKLGAAWLGIKTTLLTKLPQFQSNALNPGIVQYATAYLEAIQKIDELYSNNEFLQKIAQKKRLGEEAGLGELCEEGGTPVPIAIKDGRAISQCLPVKKLQDEMVKICSKFSFDEYQKDDSPTQTIVNEARVKKQLEPEEYILEGTPHSASATICTIEEENEYRKNVSGEPQAQLTMTLMCTAETDNDRTFELPITASGDHKGNTILAHAGQYCQTNKKEEKQDEK